MNATPAHGRAGDVARAERAALYPVLAAAFVLRVWHLGWRNLWTDEGSTWTAARGTLAELIRHCVTRDASPPLHYLLTWAVLRFGDSEVQLRAIPVIASIAMVWLTYRIARLFAPRREAVFAAALCAISPFQILYAQEARTYATVAVFMTWALFLFARAVLGGRPRDWVALALVQALALYTQQIALLGIGVQATIVLLSPEARRRFVPWIASTTAAAVLFLPWVAVSFAQTARMGESHWYVPKLGSHGIFQVIRAVLLSPVPLIGGQGGPPIPRSLFQTLLALVPLVPLVAAAGGLFARDVRGWVVRLLFASAFLPLLVVLVSSLHEPLLLSRYFVFVGPPIAVLLAHGALSLRPSAIARSWSVLLLVVGVWGWVRYDRDYDKEPWREMATRVSQDGSPGTVVLVPFDLDPFAYYDRRLGLQVPAFEFSHPDQPFASTWTPAQMDEMERTARTQIGGANEVWVVVRSPNSEIRREVARRAEKVAGEGRTLIERGRLQPRIAGALYFTRFRRLPPSAAR